MPLCLVAPWLSPPVKELWLALFWEQNVIHVCLRLWLGRRRGLKPMRARGLVTGSGWAMRQGMMLQVAVWVSRKAEGHR